MNCRVRKCQLILWLDWFSYFQCRDTDTSTCAPGQEHVVRWVTVVGPASVHLPGSPFPGNDSLHALGRIPLRRFALINLAFDVLLHVGKPSAIFSSWKPPMPGSASSRLSCPTIWNAKFYVAVSGRFGVDTVSHWIHFVSIWAILLTIKWSKNWIMKLLLTNKPCYGPASLIIHLIILLLDRWYCMFLNWYGNPRACPSRRWKDLLSFRLVGPFQALWIGIKKTKALCAIDQSSPRPPSSLSLDTFWS